MPPTSPPTPRVHASRRPDCPRCGSQRLRTRLRSSARLPHKTGTSAFVVEEGEECAHHPYRHEAAARAMLPYPEPESWLDVGTGYGHFPAVAKEVHPYTSFDGLDPTPRVEKAQAAGRVEEAHRGRLPDLVDRLRGRYDVVSMLHHLEHSPDPREELRAALAVLRPGGHLLIEAPDPDCAFGALLGKWWAPYGRSRDLHLMPLGKLLDELDGLGCTVVATDRREPHVPYDLTGALALAVGRRLTTLARTPLLASTLALDHALAPLLRRTRFSNAYRIIARRNAQAPPAL
ncbi:class I SAM-dependent methyltransferase [Streptomyces sporangiiformans]|uniref:Class I SAM-dependent methyltransferase n=1 Tax=Streptomyces sporangiiformans TaxID=2315329 RepID=A0A505DDS1_9ACTN|nr:class I SAM-dependent methyltransferase [Streptomyces sporangiiformans]TPQ17376.1 class I SAM-dependent methyltransferase [Streptomyces sporangiiformans]